RGHALSAEDLDNPPVVLKPMDGEAIPFGGDGVHSIPGIHVLDAAATDGHALFRCEPNVVACLLLLLRQHLFLGRSQIHPDGGSKLHRRRGAEAGRKEPAYHWTWLG